MGKQFNYYIAPEEDLEFTNQLTRLGYSIMEYILVEENGASLWKWKKLDVPFDNDMEITRKTYIYKEDWGELKEHINKSEVHKDPVIEQIHCKLGGKDKDTLVRGRIFLDTSCKDEMESFDVISKEYQTIVKLIKKKITYKDYTLDNGRNIGWSISEKAVKLIERGVKQGA